MPNRIIKESIRTSYEIDRLSIMAEITFYRLLTLADDYGLFLADPRILKSELFPLKNFNSNLNTTDNNSLTVDRKLTTIDSNSLSGDISSWINEIVKVGIIKLYSANSKPYGYFSSWKTHQRIRNEKPKHPKPEKNPHFDTIEDLMKSLDCNLKTIDSDSLSIDSDSRQNASVIQSNPIQSESNLIVQDSKKIKSKTEVSLVQDSSESLDELSVKVFEKVTVEKREDMLLKNFTRDEAKGTKDISILATWYCYNSIRSQFPDHKNILNAKLKTWHDPIRLLVEVDKRALEEIREVWDWTRNDPFWKVNILSTAKFREKYSDLLVKYRNGNGKENGFERLSRVERELENLTQEDYDQAINSD